MQSSPRAQSIQFVNFVHKIFYFNYETNLPPSSQQCFHFEMAMVFSLKTTTSPMPM